MIEFTGRLVLLDIEGTVSNLAFVHEVLFPYARLEVAPFLEARGATPEVRAVLEEMARNAGRDSFSAWCPYEIGSVKGRAWVVARVLELMGADAKQGGLKQLQGLIWEKGFRDGTLRAHVFPEVAAVLGQWKRAGLRMSIYSSGSVAAQRLFFAHSEAGDLTPHLSGHYDTTTGPKRASASYEAIARAEGLPPGQILFLSDVPQELDAARAAGLRTGLAERPGNPPVAETSHPRFRSFEEIVIP